MLPEVYSPPRPHAGLATGSRFCSYLVSGFFYNLGRQIGKNAVPTLRKTKWIWQGLSGEELEVLAAEESLGRTMARELRAISAGSNDAVLASELNAICQRLSMCVRDNRRTFSCEILVGAEPSVTGLPGGYLFLTESMVDWCERQPEELAFLLGHEMGHIVHGHTWDRIINDAALKVVAAVSMRAGQLGSWFRREGAELLRNAHTRDQEFQADAFGARLAAAAGYESNGAVSLLERVGRHLTEGVDPGVYFASHPPLPERIARLRKVISAGSPRA